MTNHDERCEQALAFGRSHGWMLAHGYTTDDIDRAIQRMNAAVMGDNAAYVMALHDERKALDEDRVEAIIAGTLIAPRGYSPTAVEAVRRLAAQGLNDADIGRRIGRSKDAITALRRRHDIAPGVPRTGSTGELSWRKIRQPWVTDQRPTAKKRRRRAASSSPECAIIGAANTSGPGGASTPLLRGLTPTRRG